MLLPLVDTTPPVSSPAGFLFYNCTPALVGEEQFFLTVVILDATV